MARRSESRSGRKRAASGAKRVRKEPWCYPVDAYLAQQFTSWKVLATQPQCLVGTVTLWEDRPIAEEWILCVQHCPGTMPDVR